MNTKKKKKKKKQGTRKKAHSTNIIHSYTSTSGHLASDGAPPVSSLPTAKIDDTTDLSLDNSIELKMA
jgi:hypothetical protein